MMDWQQQIDADLLRGNWVQAARRCEQAIEQNPEQKIACWYMGLIALLQGQEDDAQVIWLTAMANGDPAQIEQWTFDLAALLQREAARLQPVDRRCAWLLRRHLQEITPGEINNLLHLLDLALELEQFDPEDLVNFQMIELLDAEAAAVDDVLLLKVLKQALDRHPEDSIAVEFAAACLPHARSPQDWIEVLLSHVITLATTRNNNTLACRYAELCLRLNGQHPPTLMSLSRFCQTEGRYAEAIEFAQRYADTCQHLNEKITAHALLLRALMGSGTAWQAAIAAQQQQIALLHAWLTAADRLDRLPDATLCSALFFAPYLSDRPQETRALQNQVASRYQTLLHRSIEQHLQPDLPALHYSDHRKLRIGYLSRCLRQHSVGWLCRWVFHHFDRDRFEVYAYFHQQAELKPFSQQWFADKATQSRCITGAPGSIAQQIRSDAIDILVDLDSLTVPATCSVMALKPAPIQATWLGLDATGLPAIDYFIADPYVLPESAQDYYSEKIWRLPQTYIAVDGFEVGVPTVRREQLGIPSDAVVYLSSQSAYKRHPDTVRSQMQILKQVPNSYFLVKGLGDEQGVQAFFEQLAAAAGVARERLRFLPIAPDEQTHRANLSIADVVLDTFPYNGATTTLETLWMGIPLVTQVGAQFASRNSYTMLMNVGVTEGIAWTSEDYVAWGVRFGQQAELRQQVSWKLRQSRYTSLLWNSKQFTRDLEQAYAQMWKRYVENQENLS